MRSTALRAASLMRWTAASRGAGRRWAGFGCMRAKAMPEYATAPLKAAAGGDATRFGARLSTNAYFFSESRISRSSNTSSGAGAGAAGAAGAGVASRFMRFICLTIRKMTKARMTKFSEIVMKLP